VVGQIGPREIVFIGQEYTAPDETLRVAVPQMLLGIYQLAAFLSGQRLRQEI